MNPQVFVDAAAESMIKCDPQASAFTRRWMSAFGASPIICSILWNRIDPYNTMPSGVGPKHLLWGLYFLQVYDTEENSAQRAGGVDEKTFRKWSHLFVEAISYLECEVILWDNRYLDDQGNKTMVTIDGTDMPVQMKFSERFLSHKFNGNGLKYEVAVCIATGRIVWIHGPICAGEHDITVARQSIVSFLDDCEMAVTDRGYRGERRLIKTPDYHHFRTAREYADASVARSRHEAVNKRLKNKQVLVKQFRHSLQFHSSCFRAVAVIEELNIENGHPMFDVEYCDEGRRRKRKCQQIGSS